MAERQQILAGLSARVRANPTGSLLALAAVILAVVAFFIGRAVGSESGEALQPAVPHRVAAKEAGTAIVVPAPIDLPKGR